MSIVFRFLKAQSTDPGKEPVYVRFGQFGQFHGGREQRESADQDTLSRRICNPEIFAGDDTTGGSDHVVNVIYAGRQAAESSLDYAEA